MMDYTKTTRLGIKATAIAVVTLSLVTAAVVVSTMVPTIVQTAHTSCITNKGNIACSGGSPSPGASSFSTQGIFGPLAASGPSGSTSASVFGEHRSTSHSFQGGGNCADSTCSGNK